MASSDLLYITDAAILEADLSGSKRTAGWHECPEQYDERTCCSTSDSFVLFLTFPVLLITSFFTYLTSAVSFCLGFVPASCCYTPFILFLNLFWLRWVYFNKLGLSQWWEEEEVYFGRSSTRERNRERESINVCFCIKRATLTAGSLSNFLADPFHLSFLLPAHSFELVNTFKQTEVTADFVSHHVSLATRSCLQPWTTPPPNSSSFMFSQFAFSLF